MEAFPGFQVSKRSVPEGRPIITLVKTLGGESVTSAIVFSLDLIYVHLVMGDKDLHTGNVLLSLTI
jgi:hypothetical protein